MQIPEGKGRIEEAHQINIFGFDAPLIMHTDELDAFVLCVSLRAEAPLFNPLYI